MTTIHNKAEIGEGIYTVPDIAAILDLPVAKVRRWLTEFWDARFGKSYNATYSWGDGRTRAVNFHTLIEFYVFYQLREQGISSQKILKAHEVMAKVLHTPYPFATSKVLTFGKNILFSPDISSLMEADEKFQMVLKKIVEPFCKNIDFDSEFLAERFYPMGKKHRIVVDPHHQFGQPTIKGTNIAAETIYNMHESGETVDFIARIYELDKKSVNDAIKFGKMAA